MIIHYKDATINTDKARKSELFLVIADCAKELRYDKYKVIEACAEELAHRSTGYHQRMRIAEINQNIYDTLAMLGR